MSIPRVTLRVDDGVLVKPVRRKGDTSKTVSVTVNKSTDLAVEPFPPPPPPVPAPPAAPPSLGVTLTTSGRAHIGPGTYRGFRMDMELAFYDGWDTTGRLIAVVRPKNGEWTVPEELMEVQGGVYVEMRPMVEVAVE